MPDDLPVIACDTETTGLDVAHGCRPYMVILVDEQGVMPGPHDGLWEWDVDPLTRLPIIPPEHPEQIRQALRDHQVAFTNCKFDIHVLESIGVNVPELVGWDNIHDTLCSAHALDNRARRGLKERTALMGIPTDDQQAMKDAADQARSLVMSPVGHKHFPELKEWQWAQKGHPHFPSADKGWNMMDAWLPKAFHKWLQEQDHAQFRARYKRAPAGKAIYYKSTWHERVAQMGLLDPDHEWKTSTRKYGRRDGERTIILHLSDQRRLAEHDLQKHYELNRRIIEALYDTESRGANLRLDRVAEDLPMYERKALWYRDAANALLLGTPHFQTRFGKKAFPTARLRKILYEHFRLPILKWTRPKQGEPKPKTDQATLLELLESGHCGPPPPPETAPVPGRTPIYVPEPSRAFIENYLLHNKYNTTVQYLTSYERAAIPDDEQNATIHGTIDPTGTDQLRVSASQPNTQNISTGADSPSVSRLPDHLREVLLESGLSLRDVFGPPPGWEWWCIDFQQFHPRIFAWISNDEKMKEVFRSGSDTYYAIASEVYDVPIKQVTKRQRKVGKTVDLADLYEAGPDKITAVCGEDGRMVQWKLRDRMPTRYGFIDKLKAAGRLHGMVYTSGGYPISVPPRQGKQSPPFVNYRVACQEGECVKTAIPLCYDYVKHMRTLPMYREEQPFISFYVHDEMVFALPIREQVEVRSENGLREINRTNLNLPHVQKLGQLMVDAVASFGIEVPVGFEQVRYPEVWGGKQPRDIPITVPRIGAAKHDRPATLGVDIPDSLFSENPRNLSDCRVDSLHRGCDTT